VATPETEERLLAVARAGTAAHVERIVRGWRQVDRQAEIRQATLQHAGRRLDVYSDDDGTVLVRGRLSPEAGALLLRALEAARTTLYPPRPVPEDVEDVSAETPTFPQQQADALTLLAETALHRGIDPGAPGERYQVVVHVDAAVLADANRPGQSVLDDGSRVPAETSQRLACDASRVVMRENAEGQLVEIGARTRTIPSALRRALQRRDAGCRFPGCGVRVAEGHHIHHWARGGPTKLSNLAMLCRRHHRAVHEEGFQIARDSDGRLTFRHPNGWSIPDVPVPPALRRDPMDVVRSGWLGERLDVGYAIDVLHPRAIRPARMIKVGDDPKPVDLSDD
jgi:5-methylcytosine-specific restriction endonuclease McrA